MYNLGHSTKYNISIPGNFLFMAIEYIILLSKLGRQTISLTYMYILC